MPKISVVLPIYNVENYLRECLDSLKNQTLKDLEFICINDGSTDGTQAILDEYAQNDERFVLVYQENQGQGAARNYGIDIARGEYLAFVDPDDWVELDAFEKLYVFAVVKNADVVQFDYKIHDEYSKKIKKINLKTNLEKIFKKRLPTLDYYTWRDFPNGCLSNLDFHSITRVYKTEFVRNKGCKYALAKRAEDHIFVQGITLLADKVFYLPEYLYHYRCRSGSTVNTQGRDNFSVFNNIDLLASFLKKNDLFDELEDDFNNYKQNLFTWHYKQALDEDLEKYKDMCKRYLAPAQYEAMLENVKYKKNFIENIFSIKNKMEKGRKNKILTILGFSFKLS